MIKPDLELLDLMVREQNEVDAKWQATAYWQEIAAPLIQYFRTPEHVINFRSAPVRTGIRSETPANPGRQPFVTGPGKWAVSLLRAVPVLNRIVSVQDDLIQKHIETFNQNLVLSYLLLKERFGQLGVLDDAREGNPDDFVTIEGKAYSFRSLGYQNLYSQLMKQIDFSKINSVLELGSGYGGQAEVILRRNPHLKYVCVDIPPWLYIAEVYLEALFPGQVLGYRSTRLITQKAQLLEMMKGKKIAMLPAWKWALIDDEFDLFWNSKSLQEMNENAANYLQMVTKHCRSLFLHAYTSPKGKTPPPGFLRDIVMQTGAFREVLCEEDLYAGRNSLSMLFHKTK